MYKFVKNTQTDFAVVRKGNRLMSNTYICGKDSRDLRKVGLYKLKKEKEIYTRCIGWLVVLDFILAVSKKRNTITSRKKCIFLRIRTAKNEIQHLNCMTWKTTYNV